MSTMAWGSDELRGFLRPPDPARCPGQHPDVEIGCSGTRVENRVRPLGQLRRHPEWSCPAGPPGSISAYFRARESHTAAWRSAAAGRPSPVRAELRRPLQSRRDCGPGTSPGRLSATARRHDDPETAPAVDQARCPAREFVHLRARRDVLGRVRTRRVIGNFDGPRMRLRLGVNGPGVVIGFPPGGVGMLAHPAAPGQATRRPPLTMPIWCHCGQAMARPAKQRSCGWLAPLGFSLCARRRRPARGRAGQGRPDLFHGEAGGQQRAGELIAGRGSARSNPRAGWRRLASNTLVLRKEMSSPLTSVTSVQPRRLDAGDAKRYSALAVPSAPGLLPRIARFERGVRAGAARASAAQGRRPFLVVRKTCATLAVIVTRSTCSAQHRRIPVHPQTRSAPGLARATIERGASPGRRRSPRIRGLARRQANVLSAADVQDTPRTEPSASAT